MNRKEHWESVYRSKRPTEVSWYQAEADLSARLIEGVVPDRSAPIIDVCWMVADVLEAELAPAGYLFWHDRAVFHFLTDAATRATYVAQVRRAVPPGGSEQAFTYCLCRRTDPSATVNADALANAASDVGVAS